MKLQLSLVLLISAQLVFIPINFASAEGINEPIKIGGYVMPGLLKEDGTGLFNQLNKAIFKEVSKSTKLTLASLNRTRKGIKNGGFRCLFSRIMGEPTRGEESICGFKTYFL